MNPPEEPTSPDGLGESGTAEARARQGAVQLLAFVGIMFAVALDYRAFLFGLAILAVVLPPRVGWRPVKPLAVLARYVPFAVVWVVFLVGYLQAMRALELEVPVQPALEQFATQGLATAEQWLQLAFVVLLAPVVEELLYRGYLFTGLDALLPRVATHLLTAAVFGLAHGLPYALPIGVLSLFFGWMRARYDALLPAVLAHVVHNGATVAAVVLWPEHLDLLFPR